ncbi:MAG: antibiotic biosynthesis monooxygenase [Proteobacteria bacterium]|jgi:autoinducer 2-degrading protein|nr:antibiotic biosynthesis monooxygenase [Pseudomonadota bacterium]MCG6934416.1 antibiotic biosynthesis monooxygenase [Pseudomonadota bacterium]
MHVTFVHVHVKPDHIEDFIAATLQNHAASVQEPGNLRFDVCQQADDPARFVLYEAYRTAADAAAHKQTGHYHRWRETVAEWMAEPRQGVVCRGMMPDFNAE